MIKHLISLLVVLFVLGLPVVAEATDYYTAKDCSGGAAAPLCSNSNDGLTRQTAELTIAAGLAHLSGGDRLIIGDGTYNERITTQFQSIPSGSVGDPTVIMAENNRMAILQPNDSTLMDSWFYGVSLLSSSTMSYITFDGLKVDMSLSSGYAYIIQNSTPASGELHHIILQNGEATGADGDCAEYFPMYGYISGCAGVVVGAHNNPSAHHDIQFLNMLSYDNTEGGFYISGASNVLVEDSEAYGNGYAFQMYDIGNNSSTGNIFRRNNFHENIGHVGYPIFGWSVMLTDGPGVQFYNNKVWGNRGALYVGYTDQDNAEIYFNTIYNNTEPCIYIDSGATGTIVKNNICYMNGSGIGDSGVSSDVDKNTTADPSFVDVGTGDFRLEAGSIARDFGETITGITTDYDGVALDGTPDVGALQFVLSGLELYVSTTGSNGGSNDCQTIGSPCLTIAYAFTQVSGTSIVNMCAGACNGAGSGQFTESVGPGDFPDNTTLQAYTGEIITMGTVYLYQNENVNLRNFIIDARVAASSNDTIDIISCQNVLIEGMDIGWANDHGIGGGQGAMADVSDNIVIRNSVIHDWVQTQTNDPGGCGVDPDTCGQHGIYPVKTAAGADEHWTLENLEFYNGQSGMNSGLNWAIHIYGGVDSIGIIEMNNIKIHDVSNAVIITACNTCYISNFEIYNNTNSGLTLGVFGTTAVNPAAYNGSIYDSGTAIGYGDYNATIKNVVAYGNATNAPQLIQGSATLTVVTSITDGTNPNWTSPSTGDFTFATSSALYNTGTDLSATINPIDILGNSRPQDGAWDIGSIEFQEAGPELSPGTRGTPVRSFIIQ